MLKPLPISLDDFKRIIVENYYYVDKTLFIKEFLESRAGATLIPRPRRFGKTLNLSMLRYFFEKTEESHAHLFDGSLNEGRAPLAVSEYKDIMKHQGQYPVIFFTLKFVDSTTWENCFGKIKQIVADLYRYHIYLLKSSFLDQTEKENFKAIIALKATDISYEVSLKNLTMYLSKYHKKNPIVLIDEYDVPIHAGFRHNYYDDVTPFIRSFFGDCIKNNLYLEFAVVTGALRVAKESIFTGMNNFEVCSLISNLYSDKFGLLEHEVNTLLEYYGIGHNTEQNTGHSVDQIKSWYNGYTSGSHTVYNPWSILNMVKQDGAVQPYWINTSTNDIIKRLVKNGRESVKENIEILIARSFITKEIRESIVYADIEKDETVLWNFLLFSGYLTFKNKRLVDEKVCADFLIPNNEVAYFYKAIIVSWLDEQIDEKQYNQMLQALTMGNMVLFSDLFSHFVLTSFSYFDVSGKQPEKFYHAFVLGMLVHLINHYEVRSNRESGFGRYDVMLIPHDKTKLGIVIEFKKVVMSEQGSIEQAVKNALAQIKEKHYAQEMFAQGISNVLAVGIAFKGKKVLIRSEKYIAPIQP